MLLFLELIIKTVLVLSVPVVISAILYFLAEADKKNGKTSILTNFFFVKETK